MMAARGRGLRLLAVVGAGLLASTAALAAEIRGTVEAGSAGNEVGITVVNTSAERPVEGVRLTLVGSPRLVTNVRIFPDQAMSVPPGRSQAFTVQFDVRPEAPAGQSETLSFRVTAQKGARLDQPNLEVTVRVVGRAVASPPTPGGSITPPGAGARPGARAGGTGPSDPRGATPVEYDWYGITASGTGFDLDVFVSGRAVLHRRTGHFTEVHRVQRGEPIAALLAEVRATVEKPLCDGLGLGTASRPAFWEQLSVTASGPHATRAEAEATFRPSPMRWLDAGQPADRAEVFRRFGCGGGGVASGEAGRAGGGGSSGPGAAGGPGGPAGAPPGAGEARPPIAAGPGSAGAPDPKSPQTAALIRQWLGVAEPPDNARGARLRYDEWGRAVGTGVSGETISPRARPDAAGGMSPAEFAWTLRDRLDSLDHCTLGEFVTRGGVTAGCQGRHGAPPPRAIAGVVGLKRDEAEGRLRAAGFVPELVEGDPPRSPGEADTVQSQAPAAGARGAAGSRVRVVVRPPWVDPARPVPDVRARTWADAQSALQRAGFQTELVGGAPAPSKQHEYTVQTQSPAAGASLQAGGKVTLQVYAAYPAPTAVPDVRGLDHAQATARLQAAGLVAEFVGGDPPRSAAEAHQVQWTRPAAGDAVAPGSRVEVAIRPKYRAPAATVPDVRGLDHAQATARLQAAGLVADFVGGDPPRSKAEEHMVQWTRPAAGATAAPGSRVEVAIRPGYREPAASVRRIPPAPAPVARPDPGPAPSREVLSGPVTPGGPGGVFATEADLCALLQPSLTPGRRFTRDPQSRPDRLCMMNGDGNLHGAFLGKADSPAAARQNALSLLSAGIPEIPGYGDAAWEELQVISRRQTVFHIGFVRDTYFFIGSVDTRTGTPNEIRDIARRVDESLARP
jgi:beta-lactam-binding protein with PASTA domain